MEKYNKFLRDITKLIEKGLFASKDIKKDIEKTIRFKMDNIVNQLNLVSREEFEVQKKLIEKLQKDMSRYNKKTKKAKKS
tara:strand:+ start:1021 stop:1260 length:240 start_codon:yes stop_codon:yes gene_type:complete